MADGPDQGAHVIWILLALVLVGSALISRRMPLGRLVGSALVWTGIFLAGYALFSVAQPSIIAWQQAQRGGKVESVSGGNAAQPAAMAPTNIPATGGAELRIPLSEDGHYWVDATVNGQSVRFLIDSGASITGLSEEAALSLALPPDPMGSTVMLQTANGTVSARRSRIDRLEVGAIRATDLPVVVSASLGTVNILGMNFLGKLRGWRVENGVMILQGP